MTPHRHWFRSYSPHVVPIRLANNTRIYSAGLGSVEFQPVIGGIPGRPVVLHDVLHAPDLGSNLLSLFHLTRVKGYKIVIEKDQVQFTHQDDLHFTATVNNHNIGYLNGHVIVPSPEVAQFASTCPLDISLWHRRCSHINFDDLKHMHSQNLVKGMVIKSNLPPDPICEPCILGKQKRHNIPKTATRQTRLLALVHTDLKDPMPVQTHEGYRYWQVFVDDSSRFKVVAFLRKKSEAPAAFKQFKAYAENKVGKRIQMSRDDKGGEYIGQEFNEFCANEGIRRQHTEPNEPHQNGVAECANEEIAAGATALLVQAKLPPSIWKYAVETFIHTNNRTPTSALNGDTPYHHWTDKKPNISYFRVFGCLAYVLIHKKERKALQPHSRKCIFIGYPDGTKAWRFWDPVERRIIVSSHAVFDERCFPGNSTIAINLVSMPDSVGQPSMEPKVVLHQGGDEDSGDDAPPAIIDDPPAPAIPQAVPPPADIGPGPASALPPPRRVNPPRSGRPQGSLKESALEKKYASQPEPSQSASAPSASPIMSSDSEDELLLKDDNDHELDHVSVTQAGLDYILAHQHTDYLSWDEALGYAFNTSEHALKTSNHDGEPETYAEAMSRPEEERKLWHKAALDEIQALIDNGTFELVQLPPGCRAIGSRWVFKVKKNADGTIERRRGRVVAQGYSQRPGFDFTETFAPTPKWAALRAILALAALEDLHLESVDISSAFLNGTLEEEVYMRQLPGFVEKGNDWVWHLQKSLYGLKQAGRCWHKKLNEVFEKMGFHRVLCEHSIWIFKREDTQIIIPVFIDDVTIASKSMQDIDRVKKELKSHFKLRDLGPTTWLLGVEIIRDRSKRILSLNQSQYILSLLKRFNLSDVNPVTTSIDPGSKLSFSMSPTTPEEIEEMHSVPYLQAVGSLMYLATATHPDISYAVGVLARFSKNPGMTHWKAVKHLFRYLKGTLDYKLTYAPDPTNTELFTTFTDADHAGNPDNGRSTGGYAVKMGTGAISWCSKLQSIVALSTTEAEYVAATSAGQEILWLRNLFKELGYTLSKSSTLWTDSNSALSVAKNPEHHGRMKHLDLRFYWLRNEVEKGTINIQHLRTDEMPADVLTKPLARIKLTEMANKLGLRI